MSLTRCACSRYGIDFTPLLLKIVRCLTHGHINFGIAGIVLVIAWLIFFMEVSNGDLSGIQSSKSSNIA